MKQNNYIAGFYLMERFIPFLLFVILSCEGVDRIYLAEEVDVKNPATCQNTVISTGKYYEKNGNQYLWAGEDSTTHFNITDWSLNACNLKFGLGRETFNALTEPEYEPLSSVMDQFQDTTKAVVITGMREVKVFPFPIMRTYETVNETVDGIPIAVVYCYLAELATTFKREICGEVLTFAVSGYVYDGLGEDSFILWDRNTESLWWPIDEVGVSGVYQDAYLPRLSYHLWGIADIGDIARRYPNALVLKKIQPRKEVGEIRPTPGCK